MIKYFEKVGNKELNVPIKLDKVLNEYGLTVNNEFIGVRYYKVDSSIEKKLLKTFIYPTARKHFTIALMVINNSYIPPHTDNQIKMVLNYYLETADATTYFWKPNRNKLSTIKLDNQIDGKLFQPNELECTGTFKADKFDLWMLNVSEIHSVGEPTSDSLQTLNLTLIRRIAYSFQSDLSFEYVLDNKDKIFL